MALRQHFSDHHSDLKEEWKYGLPFFYFRKKPFCYFYQNKASQDVYIGFSRGYKSNHQDLLSGGRKKIKILILDMHNDIPISSINSIIDHMMELY